MGTVRASKRWALITVLLVAVGLAASPPSASAHTPHDDIFDVAVSPEFSSDDTLLAISRGLFMRSTDAGMTWQRLVKGLDNRAQPQGVAFGGGVSSRAWAVSRDGVFRSDDGGVAWTRVMTPVANDLRVVGTTSASRDVAVVAGPAAGAYITRDGGVSWGPLGSFGAAVTAVAFKKASSQVVFAGDANGVLHISGSGGAAWFNYPLAGAGSITSIAVSPSFSTDGLALIGTNTGGVLRWNNLTKTATSVTSGLTDPRVTSVTYSADYAWDSTVFASTWTGGLFVSGDRGSTWSPSNSGLVWDPQPTTLAFQDRPNFGRVVSALTDQVTRTQTVFLAAFVGLYASDNRGASWAESETLTSSILVGLTLSPQYGTDSKVAISTYSNGAFTSADAGATWSESNLGLAQRGFWDAEPDGYARLYNIVYAPPVPGRSWLYSSVATYGGSPGGVLRSSDGGASWSRTSVPGFSSPDFDTHIPFVLPSPNFANDRSVLMVDGGNGFVSRSVDEGASFQRVGTIPFQTRCLQASPNFAVDQRLLVCTSRGVYVSTDFGATWSPTARLNMTGLAVVVRSGVSETWLAATTTGLFRSTNQGVSWTRASLPSSVPATAEVVSVASSPPSSGPGTVLVSIRGRGLLRSTDGGATFGAPRTALLDANEQLDNSNAKPTASAIAFSPAFGADRTVFGYSNDHLFRSIDGGATWVRVVFPRATHTGLFPVAPSAPVMGTATSSSGSASVTFTPSGAGGAPAVRFDSTCTSTNGGVTGGGSGPSSPVMASGLTNGKTYTCRVTATNAGGISAPSGSSNAVVPIAVPSAPPTVTAVAGPGQATVSWTVPSSDGGSPITGYTVTPYVGYFVLPSTTFGPASTSQTLTGLTNGTSYRFSVVAINGAGASARSALSNLVVPA